MNKRQTALLVGILVAFLTAGWLFILGVQLGAALGVVFNDRNNFMGLGAFVGGVLGIILGSKVGAWVIKRLGGRVG